MKRFKGLISAPVRRSVAMPLIFGLATIVAAPTVEAVTINAVDILNGRVDVNQDNATNGADNLNNVALWCDVAAPTRVDIIAGRVDVNENNVIDVDDDLSDCDLTDENAAGKPATNQVDITNGGVNVNEVGGVDAADDAFDIQLFVLP